MNHDDASAGAVRAADHGEASAPSFSGDERPIVQRVFKKLCRMSDTLEEIEGWMDARSEGETHLLVPSSARHCQLVLTPENLDLFVAEECQAIVESREAVSPKHGWIS